MSAVFEQFDFGTTWAVTVAGATAGNSLIGIATADGGTFTSWDSDQDGSFTEDSLITGHGSGQESLFYTAHLHNISAGTHSVDIVGASGLGEDVAVIWEVSGLANSGAEGTNEDSTASGTSHPTGSVTASADAFVCMFGSYSSGAAETENANFTKDLDGSRELAGYYIPTSGGAVNGDWTTGGSVGSGSVIASYAPTGGGPAATPKGIFGLPLHGPLAGPI